MSGKVAVVTGANKGIGFAVVKGLCQKYEGIVYLTARNESRGLEAVKKMHDIGFKPQFHLLDVNEKESIKTFANHLKLKHGGIDVLVNNAGILEWNEVYPNYEAAKRNIDTNYRSLISIEKYLYPLLRDGARIVNLTSSAGHLSNLRNKKWLDVLTKKDLDIDDINAFVESYLESLKNGTFKKEDFADDGKHAEYRVAKMALSALSMVQQRKYNDRNISINVIHPGHVNTDITQIKGGVDPDEAAKKILYIILEASPDLKGTYMRCNKLGQLEMVDWYDFEGNFHYIYRG